MKQYVSMRSMQDCRRLNSTHDVITVLSVHTVEFLILAPPTTELERKQENSLTHLAKVDG